MLSKENCHENVIETCGVKPIGNSRWWWSYHQNVTMSFCNHHDFVIFSDKKWHKNVSAALNFKYSLLTQVRHFEYGCVVFIQLSRNELISNCYKTMWRPTHTHTLNHTNTQLYAKQAFGFVLAMNSFLSSRFDFGVALLFPSSFDNFINAHA